MDFRKTVFVRSAAKAKVVAGLFRGLVLMGKTSAADAVIIGRRKSAHRLQAVIVAAACMVGNAYPLRDAVTEKGDLFHGGSLLFVPLHYSIMRRKVKPFAEISSEASGGLDKHLAACYNKENKISATG